MDKLVPLEQFAHYDKCLKEYINKKFGVNIKEITHCPNCGTLLTKDKCENCGTDIYNVGDKGVNKEI